MKATIYKRPHGEVVEIEMTEIDAEDEQWFVSKGIQISMEEDPAMGFVVYADTGHTLEDGEPDELIVFSGKEDCRTTMKRVREECRQRLEGE